MPPSPPRPSATGLAFGPTNDTWKLIIQFSTAYANEWLKRALNFILSGVARLCSVDEMYILCILGVDVRIQIWRKSSSCTSSGNKRLVRARQTFVRRFKADSLTSKELPDVVGGAGIRQPLHEDHSVDGVPPGLPPVHHPLHVALGHLTNWRASRRSKINDLKVQTKLLSCPWF